MIKPAQVTRLPSNESITFIKKYENINSINKRFAILYKNEFIGDLIFTTRGTIYKQEKEENGIIIGDLFIKQENELKKTLTEILKQVCTHAQKEKIKNVIMEKINNYPLETTLDDKIKLFKIIGKINLQDYVSQVIAIKENQDYTVIYKVKPY